MDAIFVVGGKNSANTCRLADLSRKQDAPTYHIETADEIRDADLMTFRNIGVSAGASTPNWIIDQVMDRIAEVHPSPFPRLGLLLKAWLWAVRTDVYSAAGAACLALAGLFLQEIPASAPPVATAAFFVFAMHVLNRLTAGKQSRMIGSFREQSYLRHEKIYPWQPSSSLCCPRLSLAQSWLSFVVLFFMSLAGGLYNMKIMPEPPLQRLRDIPGSKNFFRGGLGHRDGRFARPSGAGSSPGMAVAFFFTFAWFSPVRPFRYSGYPKRPNLRGGTIPV